MQTFLYIALAISAAALNQYFAYNLVSDLSGIDVHQDDYFNREVLLFVEQVLAT